MVLFDSMVNCLFGTERLRLDLPKGWIVEKVKTAGSEANPLGEEEIRDAFQHPIGAPTIGEMARGKEGRIVIVIDDWTRPTPTGKVLPYVLEELHGAGVSDGQILILCGNGTHITMKIYDYARKVGWDVVERYNCINHNIYENLADLGFTSYGTHLLVNKDFAEADLRIAICGIKKHGGAGAGGGGKAVLPGISSMESIYWNHTFIRESVKGKKAWMIKGNAERMDMQDAGRMAGLDVTVNCNYNDELELVGLHVGDLDEAWSEAVKLGYKLHSAPPLREKADIVIVNAYPQASHGIDWSGAIDSLREGGSAVAIHHDPYGFHEFFLTTKWGLNPYFKKIWPSKPWPVEQAESIIVFDPHPSMRHISRYSGEVEWVKRWNEVVSRLEEEHGEEARVTIYPSKLQFNPEDYPLKM